MGKKLKTIQLSGKEYAQVAERLRAIHGDHKDFDILTDFKLTDAGNVTFKATLIIRDKKDAKGPVTYNGHSFGKNGQVKAFEKLETIAVGRALAFAGYHADGEIASADEMKEYGNEVEQEAIFEGISAIQSAKTVKEMEHAYKALPLPVQRSKEVIDAGKVKRKELTTIE